MKYAVEDGNMYARYAEARDRAGVTDSEVARATGITKSTICDWGKGRYEPKARKLLAIAKFLKIKVEWLIEG